MLEFQLFRVKVFFPAQLPLLERPPSRQELLRQAIESLPSADSRRGLVWHIGNVAAVDRTGLYLRVGRTTTTTVEVFEDGRFRDQTFETAPYILLILIALVGWTVAGLSVFDSFWPTPARTHCYFAARASLFGLSSLALRECWHVVLGAQWMLLVRREIRRSKGNQEKR
jgi:hypothetical protein